MLMLRSISSQTLHRYVAAIATATKDSIGDTDTNPFLRGGWNVDTNNSFALEAAIEITRSTLRGHLKRAQLPFK